MYKRQDQYDDVDTAIVMMKFENGALGVIDNSRAAHYGYDQRTEVHLSLIHISAWRAIICS